MTDQYYASVMKETHNRYLAFCKSTDVSVRTMVNTFERKKNAYAIKKTSYRKSGSLDLKKIANYKTSEHIFQKKSIQPKMKNHKVVILVDWSGSISYILEPIVMQAINVAQFCKKAGIEFSVYGFVNNHRILSAVLGAEHKGEELKDKNAIAGNYVLVEFLCDKMNQKEFSEGCEMLFALTNKEIREQSYANQNSGMFSLNSTPLNSSLVNVKEIIASERAKYHSYNLIILTDGDSDQLHSNEGVYKSGTVLVDGITNKRVECQDWYGRVNVHQTSAVIGLIKDLGVSTMMFYFYRGRMDRGIKNMISETIHKNGVHTIGKDDWIKNCKEIFYIDAHAMFNLSSDASEIEQYLDDDEDDYEEAYDEETGEYYAVESKPKKPSTIKVESKDTVKSITNTFVKGIEGDKIKKLVGNRLVEAICSTYAA